MDRLIRAQPVTIISPMHRWWAPWLRASWPVADRSSFIKRTLLRLSFIHFARWSLIERVRPDGGRLAHAYLLFQSNFNDDINAYVDAFSQVVPLRMRAMWQGVFGFPGPRPVDRFLDYVVTNVTPTHYYYCAYGEASSTMICAALELRERHERFRDRCAGLSDDRFASEWSRFLEEAQRLL
jgi:hypothetical protein